MRILISGMAGFIASAVTEWLLKNTEHEIIGIDRLDFSGTLHRIADIDNFEKYAKRIDFVWHDLRAPINNFTAAKIGEVDLILHLAACTHVDRSIENPVDCVYDNVIGTLNLLEYARKCTNKPKFLYFSTDEVFGPAPVGINYNEFDRYNSGNPYAASKAGAEELCVAYANTYGMNMVITHTMNVLGIRQNPEKFIPSTIRKILNNEKVIIHGSRDCSISGSRYYIHTEDVARALDFILNYQIEPSLKYNIVGLDETTNLEVAQEIAQVLNKQLTYEIVDFHSSRPGHDLRYALDGTLLNDLGFEYNYTFKSMIKSVVEWYVLNREWL